MGKKKKYNNDIIISALGTSQQEVTGSCWSISYPKKNNKRGLILLECGLSQSGGNVKKHYNINKQMIDNIGKDVIKNCNFVLLGHAHIDHIGNTPIFNDDNGFNGKILGSNKTIKIGKELIKDSVFIHSKNIAYLKKNKKKIKPLYTEEQMFQMFEHMQSIEINQKIQLDDNVWVTFYTNSHVVGSTSIFIEIKKPNNSIKTILYSSDMGSKNNKNLQPYLFDNNIPKKCNIFISEATYSNKTRQFNKKEALQERKILKLFIKKCLQEEKRILFTTFSFSRSQLLLTMFYNWFKDEKWFKDIPIILDGVLVNKINSAYLKVLEKQDAKNFKKVLEWKNIKYNKTYDDTIATLSKRTTGIYISSSGFCENGKVVNYLKRFLGNKQDVVILTGFAGNQGSVGWKIANKEQKTIIIDKKTITKKATIKQLKTFSSHISYNELLKLFSEMKCDKILIHHCNNNDKYKFCKKAKEYLRNKLITTPVIPVNKGSNQFTL